MVLYRGPDSGKLKYGNYERHMSNDPRFILGFKRFSMSEIMHIGHFDGCTLIYTNDGDEMISANVKIVGIGKKEKLEGLKKIISDLSK